MYILSFIYIYIFKEVSEVIRNLSDGWKGSVWDWDLEERKVVFEK